MQGSSFEDSHPIERAGWLLACKKLANDVNTEWHK